MPKLKIDGILIDENAQITVDYDNPRSETLITKFDVLDYLIGREWTHNADLGNRSSTRMDGWEDPFEEDYEDLDDGEGAEIAQIDEESLLLEFAKMINETYEKTTEYFTQGNYEYQLEFIKSEKPSLESKAKHKDHKVIKNSANGISFWVCKDCKIEVTED